MFADRCPKLVGRFSAGARDCGSFFASRARVSKRFERASSRRPENYSSVVPCVGSYRHFPENVFSFS